MTYESTVTVSSKTASGVSFIVARMSFGRRMDLMRRIRELSQRLEFLEASTSPGERMDAGLLRAEIDKLYVAWGVLSVQGLLVDGKEATPDLLIEAGPESLLQEVLTAVRAETGLTENERKN